jgi:AAA family ATP:ADP antiporter
MGRRPPVPPRLGVPSAVQLEERSDVRPVTDVPQFGPALYIATVSRTTLPARGPLVLPSALAWGVVTALTVTGKSTRDALFCAYFPAAELPKAMVAGAALSAICALSCARLSRGKGPGRVLPILLFLNAICFLAEHAALAAAPRATALLLYLHVSGVSGLFISGFWSVVNERFDPHALRLSISRIGLGGTLGGFVGGLTAERIAAWTDARHTLLELAVLSAFGAWAISGLAAPESLTPASTAARTKTFDSPYLRQIALFMGLTALASSVIDFAFKARAMERLTSPEDLLQFFTFFYMGVSVTSFFVQATITPRLLDRAGLGVGLSGLPFAWIASGLLALVLPGLPTQALLRGADGALVVSLFRSSYEPLYTPIAADRKRSAKAVIDVLVNRLGDALGSTIAWGLVLLLPGAAAVGANAVTVAAALACLVIASRLRKGYIAELAGSLRTGAVVLDEEIVADQTTRLTLSRTMNDLNREQLLAEIQRQRDLALQNAAPPASSQPEPPRAEMMSGPLIIDDRPGARQARLVADLLSTEPDRIRRALDQADPSLAAFVIPLLARDDVGARAMNILSGFGSRIIGQLADTLLDAGRASPTVRRRLVRVIATSQSAWAAAALAAALDDPDFDVRRQVVRGLEEIAETGLPPPIGRGAALVVAGRELVSDDDTPMGERIEHVLRLLGLVFDREAFRLARAALGNTDARLRGTALEYLDNVLPASIKTSLFAALPAAPTTSFRSERVEHELLDELRRTLA